MKDKYKKLYREQVFKATEQKQPVSLDILHQKIRDLRKALGITQLQMAHKLGVRQPTYAKMEKGLFNANISTIKRIVRELNCGVEVVLTPAEPFEIFLRKKAGRRAKELLGRTRSNMAIESQDPGNKEYERRYNDLVDELFEDPKNGLWGKNHD